MTTHEHTDTLAHVHEELEHGHGHHHVNYFAVFMALCVCTLISIVFDLVHLPKSLIVALVLAVATAKATFVLTYFMHLKFEGNWKYIILAPTAILAVGLMIALAPDVGLHYYTPDVPQVRILAEEQAHGHSHDHEKPAEEPKAAH